MSRRAVAIIAIVAAFAAIVTGCVHAPPSVPPLTGPPGPENGTDWPVSGNGPSQDATAAYLENPHKQTDIDIESLPVTSAPEAEESK